VISDWKTPDARDFTISPKIGRKLGSIIARNKEPKIATETESTNKSRSLVDFIILIIIRISFMKKVY
jgi:hypothetical protein